MELEGNLVNCPVCGFDDARVSDGVYRATETAIEVLSGPQSTYAMAAALKALAERLRSGKISKTEAIKEAEFISPKYGAILAAFSSIPGLTALSVLIMLISLYLQWESSDSSSKDNQKLLDAVIQQTFTIKEIANEQRIDRESRAQSSEKAKPKSPTLKNKLKRRTQVNKERRQKLKARRLEFGGARFH